MKIITSREELVTVFGSAHRFDNKSIAKIVVGSTHAAVCVRSDWGGAMFPLAVNARAPGCAHVDVALWVQIAKGLSKGDVSLEVLPEHTYTYMSDVRVNGVSEQMEITNNVPAKIQFATIAEHGLQFDLVCDPVVMPVIDSNHDNQCTVPVETVVELFKTLVGVVRITAARKRELLIDNKTDHNAMFINDDYIYAFDTHRLHRTRNRLGVKTDGKLLRVSPDFVIAMSKTISRTGGNVVVSIVDGFLCLKQADAVYFSPTTTSELPLNNVLGLVSECTPHATISAPALVLATSKTAKQKLKNKLFSTLQAQNGGLSLCTDSGEVYIDACTGLADVSVNVQNKYLATAARSYSGTFLVRIAPFTVRFDSVDGENTTVISGGRV